jgi:hypothetical protein
MANTSSGGGSSSGKIYGKDPQKGVRGTEHGSNDSDSGRVSFGTKTADPGFMWIFVA